ncbi:type 4a pilus biogenesis protein PilO [Phormidium sp. CCY1219]|uniref:type 4a pilus biogenesis protein PilO n=1 Tax=Phormidium sp. CCY1219 TaxID=2886104 RepID=UPI002D1EADCA|nr:type 4a pilus biogenesis protein PilO [Phormidium sp. CCY1219]MEB3827314.1 type 4a pilus biogenesis protein PilO [Phormidium sp. CCY1219]
MTVSEEFIPMEEEQEAAPPPPGSYKIGNFVITPQIQGILVAVVGVAIAGAVGWQLLLPALQERDRLETEIAQKEAEIIQKRTRISKLDEAKAQLAQVEQQKENVLGLFAQGATLETLLLDVNKIAKQSGANLELFQPIEEPDNEWIFSAEAQAGAAAQQPQEGENAAGGTSPAGLKLSEAVKGQTFEIELQGNYQETQQSLRQLERLQQMVMVGEFSAELDRDSQKIFVTPEGKISDRANPTLNTSFNLIAVMPLPPEQLKQLAAPPPPPEEEGEQEGQ